MKIEMTYEEFYMEGGYDLLSKEGILQLDNVEEVLTNPADNSWYEEECGNHDCGPYAGHWYALLIDEKKPFFAIIRTSDFSRGFEVYDTATEARAVWEGIQVDAMDIAAENGDLEEEFSMTMEEYEECKEFLAAEKKRKEEEDKEGSDDN